MISHEHKCIFVHIPKTAGISIEHFFLDLLNLNWSTRAPLLLRKNNNPKLGPLSLGHLKSHEYLEYRYISRLLFDEYFKFSFVRNPWSRMVSLYKYEGYNDYFSFEGFIYDMLPVLLENHYWFFGPQYDFVYPDGKKNVDFIGKFETLEEDFSFVCNRLNLEFDSLPHANKTKSIVRRRTPLSRVKWRIKNLIFEKKWGYDKIKSHDYRDYYDNQLITHIGQIYEKDVETFDYKFD